jgi:hypothetical protein
MRRFALFALVFVVAAGGMTLGRGLTGSPVVQAVRADDDSDFPKKRGKAIDRGVEWLKKQQANDGSWDYEDKPFGLSVHMKQGSTALAAYALLKAGVLPNDPCIQKAFDFIVSGPPQQVYAVGCVLLAFDARYNWEAPPDPADDPEEGEGTHVRAAPKAKPKKVNAPGRDLDYARQCVDFLTKAQQPQGSWRYMPNTGPEVERNDSSNPQYALLGLDAAERMGLEVDKNIYMKAIDWFLMVQEKDGPDVAPFSVPGADMSFKELRKVEKEMKEKIHKIESEFKGKKPGDVNGVGHTEEDERRTVSREAADKIIKTAEKLPKMKARGWTYAYIPTGDDANGGTQGGGGMRGGGGRGALAPWKTVVTGSMTTSGLACMIVCKSRLDGQAAFEKSLKGPVNKSIRDGAAWLAANYSVRENPKGQLHHYYYMYGLERGGMLALIPRFGEKDWYTDGSHMFVDQQKSDGQWDAGMGAGTSGPVPDTCFALLFLARGTTPVVRIPTRTATGPGGGGAQPAPQAQPQEPPKPGNE